jgi:hypothetical protein
MKLATLAFIIALSIAVGLTVASLLGYDPASIGFYVEKLGSESNAFPAPEPTANQEGTGGRPAQLIPVPSGEFHGPIGQPSVRGPSGPPPNE